MLSTEIYHRTCFIRSATRRLVFGQIFGTKVKEHNWSKCRTNLADSEPTGAGEDSRSNKAFDFIQVIDLTSKSVK